MKVKTSTRAPEMELNGVGTPCQCDEPHRYYCRLDCECNCGRLVVAAPDLFDIVRETANGPSMCTSRDCGKCTVCKARAAIAKAEGRQVKTKTRTKRCSCQVFGAIQMCPLHAAAQDLYFIAEIALRWFDAKAKDDNFKGSFPTSLLRAAVAKAEGQEKL